MPPQGSDHPPSTLPCGTELHPSSARQYRPGVFLLEATRAALHYNIMHSATKTSRAPTRENAGLTENIRQCVRRGSISRGDSEGSEGTAGELKGSESQSLSQRQKQEGCVTAIKDHPRRRQRDVRCGEITRVRLGTML